jgi:RimJ/RimL family protein N-acetyltransferase
MRVREKTVSKLCAMTVRTATLSDAPKLAEIHVAAWRAAYADHMPAEFLAGMRVEERTAMWQKALSEPSPRAVAISLDEAGDPVAWSVCGPSRDQDAKDTDIGELIAINVHPSQWRNGHGKALCHRVLAHAISQHWSVVTLWVLQGNTRARAFYEKLGFVADGVDKQDTHRLGFVLDEVRYKMRIENASN